MKKKVQIAFTLIELLVVIAIIGILSGLIIVTMNGVTSKANIAKSQIFSNSLRNALMLNLVSEWKFDGSGITDGGTATTAYTQDTWGLNHGNTIVGTPKVYSGSNCVNGSCLSFNGTNDYLTVSTSTSSPFRQSSAITYSFWFNIPSGGGGLSMGTADIGGNGSGGMGLTESSIYFCWTATSPQSDRCYTSAVSLSANIWYHVVASISFSGAGSGTIYLNGSSQTTTLSNSVTTATPVISYDKTNGDNIGGRYVNSQNYFKGFLDEVRVFNAIVPTSQIKEQYYSGLNSLFSNGTISKQEYAERMSGLAQGLQNQIN